MNLPEKRDDTLAVEINIKDRSQKTSMVNMVSSGAVSEAIMAIPDELLLMDEGELRRQCKPNASDELIKTSFWNAYEVAMARESKQMDIVSVYVRSCTRAYFFNKFITNSFKLAWCLVPPPNYEIQIETLLNKGLQRLNELLDTPIQQPMPTKDGGVVYRDDPAVMKTIHAITKDLDLRKKGAIPTASVNIHKHVGDKDPTDSKAVNQKIQELEAKLGIQPKAEDAQYTEVRATEE